MRYEANTRYLARLWMDVAPMRPNDATFARARSLLRRNDLATGIAQDPAAGQRAVLADQRGLQIVLPGESVDIQLLPTVGADGRDQPMLEFAQFLDMAATHMAAFATGFERQAFRMAFVREGFVATPSVPVERLPEHLFHVPRPFEDHAPFEWDWRLMARVERKFGRATEPLNTSATFKRASGAWIRPGAPMESFDKVRLDLDMSTSHDRTEPRFSPADVEAFFRAGIAWHDELWVQLERGLRLGEA